jgi:hypothetical protein
MKKKLLILSLFIAVLFLLSASISSVNAGDRCKKRKIKWRVAGSIVNFVDINLPWSPDPIPHYLISLSAQGRPGPAKITLIGYGSLSSGNCESGEEYQTDNSSMVARFPDQSLLFASYDIQKDNYLCLVLDMYGVGQSTFVSNMKINGGTGRFEGAQGWIKGTGVGYYFSPGALAGEVGELEGEIYLP